MRRATKPISRLLVDIHDPEALREVLPLPPGEGWGEGHLACPRNKRTSRASSVPPPRPLSRGERGGNRAAFTLVELLVVISIMAVMATLVIAFFPNAASAQREARAAQQLQGWLNIAKQRALRDQIPFGVRLIQDPTNPAQVVECQYVQQPDDFSGGVVASVLPPPGPTHEFLQFALPAGADLLNGYVPMNPAEQRYWVVQPGDSIELLGTGLVRVITGVDVNAVRVSPPLPFAISTPTPNYRIIRAPRPVGDEKLSMPDGTIIDISTNATYLSPLPPTDPNQGSNFSDIVFGPSGQVISRNLATSNINLWVRAPNPDFPADVFRGDPTIVSIFVRSGFVGAYPPDRGGNPYLLVK